MVLGVRNFSKRIDTENTPPEKNYGVTVSLASRLRTSIHDAARRRRARTTGSARTPKYAVEQAKRRSQTKSPLPVRFEVPPTLPTPVPDVEMKDAEPQPLATPAAPVTIPITLPRELERPEYREVSKETLAAVLPDFTTVDTEYIREHLQEFGPGMLKVLASVEAQPMKAAALPKELTIVVNDLSSDLPSHMLAVFARQPANAPLKRQKVTLFPTHNVVLASYCSKLPPLASPPNPPIIQGNGPQEITIPVTPLCLPSPQSFPQLSMYLYTKRTEPLLASMLPCAPPLTLETEKGQLLPFAQRLAGTYTAQALLQHVMVVTSIWQNVCALGVFDDDLWNTMDLAWEVLLTAMAIGTGNPQAMLSPRPIAPTASS